MLSGRGLGRAARPSPDHGWGVLLRLLVAVYALLADRFPAALPLARFIAARLSLLGLLAARLSLLGLLAAGLFVPGAFLHALLARLLVPCPLLAITLHAVLHVALQALGAVPLDPLGLRVRAEPAGRARAGRLPRDPVGSARSARVASAARLDPAGSARPDRAGSARPGPADPLSAIALDRTLALLLDGPLALDGPVALGLLGPVALRLLDPRRLVLAFGAFPPLPEAPLVPLLAELSRAVLALEPVPALDAVGPLLLFQPLAIHTLAIHTLAIHTLAIHTLAIHTLAIHTTPAPVEHAILPLHPLATSVETPLLPPALADRVLALRARRDPHRGVERPALQRLAAQASLARDEPVLRNVPPRAPFDHRGAQTALRGLPFTVVYR